MKNTILFYKNYINNDDEQICANAHKISREINITVALTIIPIIALLLLNFALDHDKLASIYIISVTQLFCIISACVCVFEMYTTILFARTIREHKVRTTILSACKYSSVK